MFKFIKKLFGSGKQLKESAEDRPALSYVKEMNLTENQTKGIVSFVRYKTDYEHNYQYRLSEFIRDLQSGKIEQQANGVGKKTVQKILNQLSRDGLL